jgi:hypothetical protein
MKKILLVSAALMLAHVAFPQGQVNFDNLANPAGTPGVEPGAVRAPIYNIDPACPTCPKQGNTSGGVPVGTQTYGGLPLFNDSTHTYTVTLWALDSANVTGDQLQNNLALVGTTTMRTSTSGNNAGRVAISPTGNPVVQDVIPGSTERATFQVRVWDSLGGTITSWDQVLARTDVARGFSTLFTVPFALQSGGTAPPNLEGLQSFQLFIVPEPSVIALGVLGAGCLFLLRRRK